MTNSRADMVKLIRTLTPAEQASLVASRIRENHGTHVMQVAAIVELMRRAYSAGMLSIHENPNASYRPEDRFKDFIYHRPVKETKQ